MTMSKKKIVKEVTKPTPLSKVESLEKTLEIIRNLCMEGILSGQIQQMTILEVIASAVKAVSMMGLDLTNSEHLSMVLEEAQRLADKAAIENGKVPVDSKQKRFIDPHPSKLVH